MHCEGALFSCTLVAVNLPNISLRRAKQYLQQPITTPSLVFHTHTCNTQRRRHPNSTSSHVPHSPEAFVYHASSFASSYPSSSSPDRAATRGAAVEMAHLRDYSRRGTESGGRWWWEPRDSCLVLVPRAPPSSSKSSSRRSSSAYSPCGMPRSALTLKGSVRRAMEAVKR